MSRCFLLLFVVLVTIASCKEPVYTPKPRGYPKIEFPDKGYDRFDAAYCDFTFEKPIYAAIIQDTLYFDGTPEHPCWFNLEIPILNGTIHCSYKPVNENNRLDEMINDAYKLANKHNIKADFIDDFLVSNSNGVHGAILEIEGSVASPFQFYLTDSLSHFLRGSLYFNSRPEPDSMAPVIEFVKQDVIHMVNTFSFQKR
ncbi:MAG: hypothetical protein AAF502_08095 [Bacteroidota bacterium]